jgi:hypothetical protein
VFLLGFADVPKARHSGGKDGGLMIKNEKFYLSIIPDSVGTQQVNRIAPNANATAGTWQIVAEWQDGSGNEVSGMLDHDASTGEIKSAVESMRGVRERQLTCSVSGLMSNGPVNITWTQCKSIPLILTATIGDLGTTASVVGTVVTVGVDGAPSSFSGTIDTFWQYHKTWYHDASSQYQTVTQGSA